MKKNSLALQAQIPHVRALHPPLLGGDRGPTPTLPVSGPEEVLLGQGSQGATRAPSRIPFTLKAPLFLLHHFQDWKPEINLERKKGR